MEINNQLRTIKFKLRKFIFLLAFVILIIVLHFTEIWAEPRFGITKIHMTLAFVAMIVLYYIIEYVLDFQYIYFSDHGEKVILRYYSLRPMQNLKNSIEIPKPNLVKFEIIPSYLNLKPSLILYARNKTGVAKYPSVCLSALTKQERQNLIHALSRIAPQV